GWSDLGGVRAAQPAPANSALSASRLNFRLRAEHIIHILFERALVEMPDVAAADVHFFRVGLVAHRVAERALLAIFGRFRLVTIGAAEREAEATTDEYG